MWERRLRASWEQEEGLDLADGSVLLLDANHEADAEAPHGDFHCSIGRYVLLSTWSDSEAGRFCPVGTGFDAIEDIEAAAARPDEAEWQKNILCAVYTEDPPPACAGNGYLVRPASGASLYRMRIVTDDFVAEDGFLAGITLEVQRLLSP